MENFFIGEEQFNKNFDIYLNIELKCIYVNADVWKWNCSVSALYRRYRPYKAYIDSS